MFTVERNEGGLPTVYGAANKVRRRSGRTGLRKQVVKGREHDKKFLLDPGAHGEPEGQAV